MKPPGNVTKTCLREFFQQNWPTAGAAVLEVKAALPTTKLQFSASGMEQAVSIFVDPLPEAAIKLTHANVCFRDKAVLAILRFSDH